MTPTLGITTEQFVRARVAFSILDQGLPLEAPGICGLRACRGSPGTSGSSREDRLPHPCLLSAHRVASPALAQQGIQGQGRSKVLQLFPAQLGALEVPGDAGEWYSPTAWPTATAQGILPAGHRGHSRAGRTLAMDPSPSDVLREVRRSFQGTQLLMLG